MASMALRPSRRDALLVALADDVDESGVEVEFFEADVS